MQQVSSRTHLAEWLGAIFGVGGTLLAAVSASMLFMTFIAYSVSNSALIYASINRKAPGLFAMNFAYACITIVGLVNHFPGGVS